MMYTSLEIEIKSGLTKEEYEKLIKTFNLEGKTFIQTNYYFDTNDHDLLNNHIILRIREKEHNIKLTSKTKQDDGALEKHIILEKDKALEMIKNGFDANIIGIDKQVNLIASLQTERVKTPYKNGILFFDKNTYYDTIDYEVEFEATDQKEGQIEFEEFLNENNLTYKKLASKSKRAYMKASL